MHSRIYQITDVAPERHEEVNCYDSVDYFDIDSTSIDIAERADYISDETSMSDDMDWLFECYSNYIEKVEDNGIQLKPGAAEKMLKERYDKIHRALEEEQSPHGLWLIADIASPRYGFRVHAFDMDSINFADSIEEWICGEAEENVIYYVLNTLDYHY